MRLTRGLRQVVGPLLTVTAVVATVLVLSAERSTDPAEQDSKADYEVIDISVQEAKRLVREAARRSEERARRVQQVCARHHQGLYRSHETPPDYKEPPIPNYSVFYFDRKVQSYCCTVFEHFHFSLAPHLKTFIQLLIRQRRTAWCPLYKAGSSSWLVNLILLAGYPQDQLKNSTRQLSDIAREYYPSIDVTEAEEVLQRSIKMLVVRHPFARLLSAYRDKLEHNTPERARHGAAHFYRKYGKRIVAKHRRPGHGNYGPEPTFQEFVKYLISEDLVHRADDHWIPYYLFCTPCLLRYDMIAAVESYIADQVWMIHALGVQDQLKPRWRHKTKDSRRIDTSAIDPAAHRYFGQLTTAEITALYEKYHLDFELFGYRMEDYLSFASDYRKTNSTL